MRVGTLEIQLLAGMARLQKDMNDAQRIVGGAMGNVERSVASAKRAMQALGVGLPIAGIVDQVRRMTDQYTKLDAQLRLATKSQAAYAQGMLDIRAISTTAQADISATSMLYTRLINTMEGTGVAQSKLATVTETISFGLKAYGATTQEAASAALQLSQAMGANRLGGEEFRAVMEAMPNVMKVLADSMGVPLGELRALSIAGKITADEMVKAFGNPAVAAEFKRLAEATRTITGAWQVARNELTLLVGEFSKSTGLTQSSISIFNAFAAIFRFAADNIGILTNALLAYTTVMTGKFVAGIIKARAEQVALNVAHTEALAMNAAMAQSEASLAAAKAGTAASTAATTVSLLRNTLATVEARTATLANAVAENEATIAQLNHARAAGLLSGHYYTVRKVEVELVVTTQALAAATAELNVATARQARLEAALIVEDKALAKARGELAIATAAVTRAEKLQEASSIGIMGRIKGLVGRAGWIGMALFGVWTVYDFLNGMQQVADGAKKLEGDLGGLANAAKLAELQITRQRMQTALSGMGSGTSRQEVEDAKLRIRMVDEQIAKQAALVKADADAANAAVASQRVQRAGLGLSHDQQVMQARMLELADQFNSKQITEAEYLKRVNEALYGKATATKHAESAISKHLASLREEIDTYGMSAEAIARYNAEKAGGNIIQQEQAVADAKHLEYLKDMQKQSEANDALQKRADERAAQRAQDAIDEQTRQHEALWKSIEGAAHDTWTRVFTEGRDAFTNIGKTIKSAILDMLYQMTVKKWLITVAATTTGGNAAASDIASAVGGGSGGVGSWLSAGKTIFEGFQSGFSSFLSSGAQLGQAVGYYGSTALGASGATATAIGTGGAYVGSGLQGIALGSMIAGDKTFAGMSGTTAATIGTAIGAAIAGPVGAVIGGALGGVVNAAFGRGPKTSGTTTLAGSFAEAGFSGNFQTPWSQKGGWFSSGRSGIDVTRLAVSQTEALSALVAGSKSVFDNLLIASGEAQASLTGWAFSINRQVATQEQANQLTVDMANSMGAHLIPSLSAFKKEGENLADAAVRMRDEFILTDSILKLVGGTFGEIGLASMGARDNLVTLMGGIQQMSGTMQSYYSNFFTDAERRANDLAALSGQFAALNVAMPDTAAGFRALVEAQDLSAESGRQTFAALMSLNGAFAALVPTAQAAEQAAANAAAQAAALAGQQRQLDIRLMEAQGNSMGALAAKRADEVAALDASLQPTLLAIFAAQDEAAAKAEAARIAQAAADAQRAAAERATQAAQDAARAAQQITDAWQSVTDAIFQEVARIRGVMGAQTVVSAQTQFAIATAQARAGDQEAAKMLPGLARAVLDIAATTAGTAIELARVRGRTLESLTTTGTSLASKYGLTIPSFAVGVNEVPKDMVAQIHKGEEIKPAAYVEADRAASANTNTLLSEIRLELAEIKYTNRKLWQTAEKHDIEGMPEVRTV